MPAGGGRVLAVGGRVPAGGGRVPAGGVVQVVDEVHGGGGGQGGFHGSRAHGGHGGVTWGHVPVGARHSVGDGCVLAAGGGVQVVDVHTVHVGRRLDGDLGQGVEGGGVPSLYVGQVVVGVHVVHVLRDNEGLLLLSDDGGQLQWGGGGGVCNVQGVDDVHVLRIVGGLTRVGEVFQCVGGGEVDVPGVDRVRVLLLLGGRGLVYHGGGGENGDRATW